MRLRETQRKDFQRPTPASAAPSLAQYRALNRLTGLRGTAVTIQAMVFGNADARSGSGVLFSRNPSTGEPGLWGEVLLDAQGEVRFTAVVVSAVEARGGRGQHQQ